MSKDSSMDISFFEKVGDFFSSFSEKVGGFLTRLLGSSNERHIRAMGYISPTKSKPEAEVIPDSLLAQINALEPQMKALSDEELQGLTPKFRERIAQGETLDNLLPEAFAACREAGLRTKQMRHYDVQMLGGIVLHRGNIAEMVTGEGKTLVATLPAYLNALTSKGVHVITVNDYLARRDCEWMLPIYRALGVSAGFIQSDQEPEARREAYNSDITYGTNSEFGFDYLRDNMKPARWGDHTYPTWYQQVQRKLNYAIIDEVDNILIDEARTPLIISGPAHSDIKRYIKANEIAVSLSALQKEEPGVYFEVKEKEHTCHLTDVGIRKAEELAGVESFYTAGNMEWPHLIDNALKAHHLYHKDKRYAVMRDRETNQMAIVIIDEFTGRLMEGRQWSDGLHQAVEAKHAREGVKIKEETQTLATVTLQNYFRNYEKLSGMTGTAMTEADEFWKIYKLEVIAIPTNRPLIRLNDPDLIYRSAKERWTAVCDEVAEVHESGRPILIGTTDVDKSLKLSEMLKRRGIKHELLNALPEHAARESEIVAQAGRIGAVTISTNMAGRGTDIILGGNPETMAWAQLKDKYASRLDVPEEEWKSIVDEIETKEKMKSEGRKVAEMGGLHIVGTERHEARRIDNQLRGRAGRQGDPGSSRFFLSLEDDLMRIFAGDWVRSVLGRLGMEDGQAIESRMISRQIEKAQKKVEERNFDIRKNLLEFDEVMDHQRKEVYGYRQEILDGANPKLRILAMFDDQIELATERFLADDYGPACFVEFASNRLHVEFETADFYRSNPEEAIQVALDKATKAVQDQVGELIEENLGSEDSSEWNWQALTNQVKSRWDIKVADRQLKKMERDELENFLKEGAVQSISQVDLSDGKVFLDKTWGVQSLCDWARLKFQLEIDPNELVGKADHEIRDQIHASILDLFRQKEIEFPVMTAIAQYMADGQQNTPGGQRYNREGLLQHAKRRFPHAADSLSEEEFRTAPRSKLKEVLQEISKAAFPDEDPSSIDEKLEEAFSGTTLSEEEDATELTEWAKTTFNLEINPTKLTGVDQEQARRVLYNAYDDRYRPEMRTMERSLLLNQVDSSWKNHLLQMDHLRSAMNLVWVGQMDPRTEYKLQGRKEFQAMWEGISDRVTEMVFRMEESAAFQETIWQIESATHEQAPSALPQDPNDPLTSNQGEKKKAEPIRNRGEKIRRNDPCPCGSGKKYKNCHMREAAV